MPVKFLNVGLIDDRTLMVQLSDLTYAAFTVEELLILQRAKKTSEVPEPDDLPN